MAKGTAEQPRMCKTTHKVMNMFDMIYSTQLTSLLLLEQRQQFPRLCSTPLSLLKSAHTLTTSQTFLNSVLCNTSGPPRLCQTTEMRKNKVAQTEDQGAEK